MNFCECLKLAKAKNRAMLRNDYGEYSRVYKTETDTMLLTEIKNRVIPLPAFIDYFISENWELDDTYDFTGDFNPESDR